jgi:hypothetical protein
MQVTAAAANTGRRDFDTDERQKELFVATTPECRLLFSIRGLLLEFLRGEWIGDAIFALRPAEQIDLPTAHATERERRRFSGDFTHDRLGANGAGRRSDHDFSLDPLDFLSLDFDADFDSVDFDSDFEEPLSAFSPFDLAGVPSEAFLSASAAFL